MECTQLVPSVAISSYCQLVDRDWQKQTHGRLGRRVQALLPLLPASTRTSSQQAWPGVL